MESGELIKRLENTGWHIRGGKKTNGGSHITLYKPVGYKIITLPHPRKDVSIGVQRQAMRTAGLN